MMRPMPFCPSLEPWKKDTSVQVTTSRARIAGGGGAMPSGSRKRAGDLMICFSSSNSSPAKTKPMIGETSSDRPISLALPHSTPEAPLRFINWLATPTPMIEPISVCDDDDGSPNAQVPRFQMIAANKMAKTMAKPAATSGCRISSTGSSPMMLKATAPDAVSTPRKFHSPDHSTACIGVNACV